MHTNPYAPPATVVADIASPETHCTHAPFFTVSVLKLVVLSVCTFGFYEVYWFYRNWQLIKVREQSDISPAPRAIFSVFYCYQCFARIRDFDTPKSAKSRLAAGPLAAGWIIVTILHKLPEPYWVISLFAVAFVVPVQARANQVNAATCSNYDPNSRFTAWNWVAVFIGSLMLALAVVGSLVPPEA